MRDKFARVGRASRATRARAERGGAGTRTIMRERRSATPRDAALERRCFSTPASSSSARDRRHAFLRARSSAHDVMRASCARASSSAAVVRNASVTAAVASASKLASCDACLSRRVTSASASLRTVRSRASTVSPCTADGWPRPRPPKVRGGLGMSFSIVGRARFALALAHGRSSTTPSATTFSPRARSTSPSSVRDVVNLCCLRFDCPSTV